MGISEIVTVTIPVTESGTGAAYWHAGLVEVVDTTNLKFVVLSRTYRFESCSQHQIFVTIIQT